VAEVGGPGTRQGALAGRPATIVVEYELTGTSTATGRQSTAGFVGVLTVRDGKVARWREYQDTLAIMTALAQ
jgi:uncharacterized protein